MEFDLKILEDFLKEFGAKVTPNSDATLDALRGDIALLIDGELEESAQDELFQRILTNDEAMAFLADKLNKPA